MLDEKTIGTYRSCSKQASQIAFDPSYLELKSEHSAKIKHMEGSLQGDKQWPSMAQLE